VRDSRIPDFVVNDEDCAINSPPVSNGVGRHGQLHHETAAHGLFSSLDRAVMVFHDPTHNRETQSGATLLGREIRQEELPSFLGNAVSGVGKPPVRRRRARDQ